MKSIKKLNPVIINYNYAIMATLKARIDKAFADTEKDFARQIAAYYPNLTAEQIVALIRGDK